MNLYAMHRVFTGRPTVRGYVYDRDTGKVVKACPHRHRRWARAQECAERMLRRALREVSEGHILEPLA